MFWYNKLNTKNTQNFLLSSYVSADYDVKVSNAFSQFYLFPFPVKVRSIWRLAGPEAGAAANVARPDGPAFG